MIHLELLNYADCYLNYGACSKSHLHEVKSLAAAAAAART